MRGEYLVNAISFPQAVGSPPLARGIQSFALTKPSGERITPACAGSTGANNGKTKRKKDHPRLRGEYVFLSCSSSLYVGSPPLARGVPVKSNAVVKKPRITPACAGSTFASRSGVPTRQDHPRLRGEYNCVETGNRYWVGSPPLARGVQSSTTSQ